ncbi:hypothetical protein Trco_006822 [Trichoderma cornu-damae]|uniref:Uncharacterized protein n=1 Tax=Trichoderma cornu-damae TaxID=654480 RepID=A0A9P8QL33_9HYPO|nr:hypothetical protein Trco_006822 [Trichoderma cornu-damae]
MAKFVSAQNNQADEAALWLRDEAVPEAILSSQLETEEDPELDAITLMEAGDDGRPPGRAKAMAILANDDFTVDGAL